MHSFASGMRFLIRNEERLIGPDDRDGYLLRYDGLSERVSGKEAIFLSALVDFWVAEHRCNHSGSSALDKF